MAKRTVLNGVDLKIIRRASAGAKVFVGENERCSIIALTPLGVVLSNDSFVFHTHIESEPNVFLGNEHSRKTASLVNYHKLVYEVKQRYFQGWPKTLTQLGVGETEFAEEKDLPRPHFSVPNAYIEAECTLDKKWLKEAFPRLSLSSLRATLGCMSIPNPLTPKFIEHAVKLVKARPCRETKEFLVKIWNQYWDKHVDVSLAKIDMEEEGKSMASLLKFYKMEATATERFYRVRLFLKFSATCNDQRGSDAVGALVRLGSKQPPTEASKSSEYRNYIMRQRAQMIKQQAVIEKLRGQIKRRAPKRKTTFVLRGKDKKKRVSAFPPRLVREVQTQPAAAAASRETPTMVVESRGAPTVAAAETTAAAESRETPAVEIREGPTARNASTKVKKIFTTCPKCKKAKGMCLKPGQDGHLLLSMTTKAHWTQKKDVDVDQYIDAVVKYKEKWETDSPGKVWDGECPRNYSIILKNGTALNVGSWVQLQKRKFEQGKLPADSIEYKRLRQIGAFQRT